MDWLTTGLEYFLHLDRHLADVVAAYGGWVYAIMFLIVFAETGFVVTPFLPGDSLLFAAGVIARSGGLNPHAIFILLAAAAILGDTINYSIGKYIGPKVFKKQKSLFFNPAHLDRAHRFYEKYGGKTIVIARFVPIIRTFAPFVAGIGKMTYARFVTYNIAGGVLWVALLTYSGYAFANLEVVKKNFSLVIGAIIVISVMPAVIEFIRGWREKGRQGQA